MIRPLPLLLLLAEAPVRSMKKTLVCAAALTAMSSLSHGALISLTGAVGGRVNGVNNRFVIGSVGTTSGANQWPGNENPSEAIDGDTSSASKYLNFGGDATGLAFSPSSPGYINEIVIWTANDSPDRDPSSYILYGSTTPLTNLGSGNSFLLDNMTIIWSDNITLPTARNTASEPFTLFNNTPYASYVLAFPTLRNGSQSLMQISEVQAFGESLAVPEPTTGILSLLAVGGLTLRRRRA